MEFSGETEALEEDRANEEDGRVLQKQEGLRELIVLAAAAVRGRETQSVCWDEGRRC